MINEIGTLRSLPNGESVFVGSSSGVFFINTVRRAFSHAAATTSRRRSVNDHSVLTPAALASPEECILGPESQGERLRSDRNVPDGLGDLPPHAVATDLVISYFRTWHPLLPFLHGPTCLQELESLYSRDGESQTRRPRSQTLAITLQCLFNLAKLDRPDLPSLGNSHIRSDEQLLSSLGPIALRRDLASIQALLAAQLYFVATMSLQAASTTGGLILRSVYKSGLHRCPFRYSTLDASDRDIRKRVFWSVYTLDRYISQSLGYPLGIQDSDIDVCLPGAVELHEPVMPEKGIEEGTSPQDSILHLPANHPQRQHASEDSETESPGIRTRESIGQAHEGERTFNPSAQNAPNESDAASQRRKQHQSVQANFVRYSGLVGRMLETFHKSIHVRSANRQNILLLKADIDAWGNDMPLRTNFQPANADSESIGHEVFFQVARQQLILLVNRPSLSLEPSSAEFRHAIQICIGASRSIIQLLEGHFSSLKILFWPGFMSAVWMSGLVLVFACQLKLHGMSNGISDISASLRIIETMTQRWKIAQNCHDALSMLLENIQQPLAPISLLDSHTDSRVDQNFDSHRSQHSRSSMRGEKRGWQGDSYDQSDRRETSRRRVSFENGPAVSLPRGPLPGRASARHSLDGFASASMLNNQEYYSGTTAAAPSTGTNHMQGQYYPGQSADMPPPLQDRHFMQQQQQTQMCEFPMVNETRGNDLNVPPTVAPNFEFTTSYDVFDGAAWGSLLELVEPHE
ncbi:hypothetical protein BU24DRAFT_465287 [Aaosphaeria arxii CBS 175.79]|uniref:Xylanolytic transcriptional activator regulatory domain-containing protein n=1 Tax=Aaosphaeria arxii CBS 175.79 TaxID=1450172 RepID=A0A6A5XI71_9PLEO|nr:uncharacterized protein BU24DRAFT_465287 [Aaosphaeria arxii CBS 175.79]KAF2012938.1 hypothetical protein BU24DRAFT_465287 [Aaosphaeria arxii CBS 175.79]